MHCPKCDQLIDEQAVLCAGCDHVLDADFFAEDKTDLTEALSNTDERRSLPPRSVEQGDPVILGDVSGEFDVVLTEETGSYLHAASEQSDDAGPLRPAPIYVDAGTAQLTAPASVLAVSEGVDLPPLTPFESHVLALLDGERTVAGVQEASGLSLEDLRIAICMLADRGLVQLRLMASPAPVVMPRAAAVPAPVPVAEVPVVEAPVADVSVAEKPEVTEVTEVAKEPPAGLREALRDVTLSSSAPGERPITMDGADLELVPLDVTPPPARAEIPPLPAAKKAPAVAPTADVAPAPAVEPVAAPPQTRPVASPKDRAKAASVYEHALRDINAGRYARARMYVKLAVSLDPDEPRYQALLEEWDKAKEVAAAADDPEHVKLVHRARDAERSGDFRGAAALLEQALELVPKSAELNNRLGVLYATRLKEFDLATKALFRAVDLAPTNATFRHNLMKVMGAAESASGPPGPRGMFEALKPPAAEDPKSRWAALLKKKLF